MKGLEQEMLKKDLRRENARLLAREDGGLTGFARKIDRSQAYVSRIIGKNPQADIGDRAARTIESAHRLPLGWLDEPHASNEESRPQSFLAVGHSVPLLAVTDIQEYLAAPASVEDIMIDRIPCPFEASDEAYAISAPSDAMQSLRDDSIPINAILFVEPQVRAKQGSVVIVEADGFADARRLQVDMGAMYAVPDNSNYERHKIRQEQILGVVTASAKRHIF